MRTYLVGGAVRDKLLGRPSKDRDHVVTDTTHEELISMGFIQVGKEHTVYLHPKTREEYTLAANINEDLKRRDLTINAMAIEGDTLIDPFGGADDLSGKILRHIQEENFYLDPLRVYRILRFAAEFPEFQIFSGTLQLIKDVSLSSGFTEILPERIVKELGKVLSSENPARFFHLLKQTRILKIHFKELDDLPDVEWQQTLKVMDKLSSESDRALHVKYASLFIFTKEEEAIAVSERLLVSNDWKFSARTAARYFTCLGLRSSPEDLIDSFYLMDAFRRPFLIMTLIRLLGANEQNADSEFVFKAFRLASDITSKDVSHDLAGKEIGLAIKEKRLTKLKSSLS